MTSTEGFFIFKIKCGLSQHTGEKEVSARFILYENRLIEQENVSVAALRVSEISGF